MAAEEVLRRYRRHWKPGTLKVNLRYYRNNILPWFRGRAIADITRRDIQQWFASLHATPVAADRSAPVLSVILKQAEVYGYRPDGSNPCTGIKRYRRCGRERFLTADEMRRLSRVLDRYRESHLLETSIARLLLLIANLARSSGTRLVVEPIEPSLGKPPAPLADRVGVGTHPLHDRPVLQTFGHRQHDPCPSSQTLGGLPASRQTLELMPLRFRQRDRHRCSAHQSSLQRKQ